MSRKKPKQIVYRQFTLYDFPIVVKDPAIKPTKKTRKSKVSVVQDEDGYIEKRPIEPANPHSCDTCKGGYFDGKVTITMDCPDYPDVSSGKIDGEKLREDTRRLGCSHWSAPGSEAKFPNIAWCCGTRDCKNLDWEGGICITTGKKIKEQTYCPTQHLAEKQPPKVRKCCPTCAHHKTKKTFEETCPRKDDLMFNGGRLSATALMLETSLKDCQHWTLKPEPVKKTKKKKEDIPW